MLSFSIMSSLWENLATVTRKKTTDLTLKPPFVSSNLSQSNLKEGMKSSCLFSLIWNLGRKPTGAFLKSIVKQMNNLHPHGARLKSKHKIEHKHLEENITLW